MKHYTSLLLLCLYVTANLCFASITDGDCAIARIPQMPSPQPAFKLRMFDKQFPRHNTLNNFHHRSDAELRPAVQKQMHVIRHDFHDGNAKVVLTSKIKHDAFTPVGNLTYKNSLAILRAPNYMILQRKDISTTICKSVGYRFYAFIIEHSLFAFCTICTKSMPSNSRLKSRECDGKFFKAEHNFNTGYIVDSNGSAFLTMYSGVSVSLSKRIVNLLNKIPSEEKFPFGILQFEITGGEVVFSTIENGSTGFKMMMPMFYDERFDDCLTMNVANEVLTRLRVEPTPEQLKAFEKREAEKMETAIDDEFEFGHGQKGTLTPAFPAPDGIEGGDLFDPCDDDTNKVSQNENTPLED